MTMTAEDVKRVTKISTYQKEFFTVEYFPANKTLTLIVDGTKRNTIELDQAEQEYEKLLLLVKNAFIDLRSPAFSITANDIKN